MRKTLLMILSILAGGIVAFGLMGCASEWKCPNAPKVVAKFSVGQKVMFTREDGTAEVAVIEDIAYVGKHLGDSELTRVLYRIQPVGEDSELAHGPAIVYEDENLLKAIPPHKFSEGQEVAFTRDIADGRVKKGDIAVVRDVAFSHDGQIYYTLENDIAFILVREGADLLEAVVYPDPALAPSKEK